MLSQDSNQKCLAKCTYMKLSLVDRPKSNTKATFLHDADKKKPNKTKMTFEVMEICDMNRQKLTSHIQIWTIPTLANTDSAVSTRISAHKTMICVVGANSIDANQWHKLTDSFDSLPRSFPFNAMLIVLKIFGNYYSNVEFEFYHFQNYTHPNLVNVPFQFEV